MNLANLDFGVGFVLYLLCMLLGGLVAAFLGWSFALWLWHGDSQAKKGWVETAVAFVLAIFGGSR